MSKVTYTQVQSADAKFQVELERQFGKRAGDARYASDLHDEATAAARREFNNLSTIFFARTP